MAQSWFEALKSGQPPVDWNWLIRALYYAKPPTPPAAQSATATPAGQSSPAVASPAGQPSPVSPALPALAPAPAMPGQPKAGKLEQFAPLIAVLLGARKPHQIAAFLQGMQKGRQGREAQGMSEYEQRFGEWKTKAGLDIDRARTEIDKYQGEMRQQTAEEAGQMRRDIAELQTRSRESIAATQARTTLTRAALNQAANVVRQSGGTKGQLHDFLVGLGVSSPAPADPETPLVSVTNDMLAQDLLQARTAEVSQRTAERQELLPIRRQTLESQINLRDAQRNLINTLSGPRVKLLGEQAKALKALTAHRQAETRALLQKAQTGNEDDRLIAAAALTLDLTEDAARVLVGIDNNAVRTEVLRKFGRLPAKGVPTREAFIAQHFARFLPKALLGTVQETEVASAKDLAAKTYDMIFGGKKKAKTVGATGKGAPGVPPWPGSPMTEPTAPSSIDEELNRALGGR